MRDYPRFLFSNPQNTKNKGPYIVHTIFPRLIIRIYQPVDFVPSTNHAAISGTSGYDIEAVGILDTGGIPNDDIIAVLNAADKWLLSQIKSGAIRF